MHQTVLPSLAVLWSMKEASSKKTDNTGQEVLSQVILVSLVLQNWGENSDPSLTLLSLKLSLRLVPSLPKCPALLGTPGQIFLSHLGPTQHGA